MAKSKRAKQPKQAKPKKEKGKQLWKIFGTGSALAAGLIMTKVLDATWATATGHHPPTKTDHPDLDGREAFIWAAISGMAIGVAKTYATRRAASYWTRSTGELPPGMSQELYKGQKTAKLG